jgi:hypothetical protein
MWDLHRNRGSVASTTERILGGRGLDTVSVHLKMIQGYAGLDLLMRDMYIGSSIVPTTAAIPCFARDIESAHSRSGGQIATTRPDHAVQLTVKGEWQGQGKGGRFARAVADGMADG